MFNRFSSLTQFTATKWQCPIDRSVIYQCSDFVLLDLSFHSFLPYKATLLSFLICLKCPTTSSSLNCFLRQGIKEYSSKLWARKGIDSYDYCKWPPWLAFSDALRIASLTLPVPNPSLESSLGIKIVLARRNGRFMSQKRLHPILYKLFVLQTTHSSKMKVIVLRATYSSCSC